MTDAELAAAIREAAYLEGEFTLRSGRRSRYYLDKYRFETRPELLAELARRLACHVDEGTDRIAGAELGAVPLATAVALETGRPFVIVRNRRKGYGTGRAIEGELRAGERVLLVEDIATSGGQALEAVQTLRDAGAEVAAVVVVIDRLEGARERIESAGLRYEALLTRRDLGIE